MPKDPTIQKVLVIGSGPIVIGQACEFDYSGNQALVTLREEGVETVLLNSNPATVMTDPDRADRTYLEPMTWEFAARIIEKERPDALLATLGGQTALNLAKELADHGVLERFGVRLIGADLQAIERAEDRLLFRQSMERIGAPVPRSAYASTLEEAMASAEGIGFPLIIRPSFTLGGQGGGIATDWASLQEISTAGLQASPTSTILIEESLLGWKEYELEIVRDRIGNSIIVCSIENIDPMGVHTGDSVTIAPSITLADREYQELRNWSKRIMEEIGVKGGGANVQFAVNPKDGRVVVIEMNPRVSRSSALASKATGYPIAKISTRLALGYTLPELKNEVTGSTSACFEPAIDYVVVKIPRFNFEKFPGAEPTLTTSMRSVGEVMAIGRSFSEAFLKALRSLELSHRPLLPLKLPEAPIQRRQVLEAKLSVGNPDRFRALFDAFRDGMTVDTVALLSGIDPWFLREFEAMVRLEARVRASGGLDSLPSELLLEAKRAGFSDADLAAGLGCTEESFRLHRLGVGISPVFKSVDTCAAEFVAETPYFYSTYEVEDELPSQPSGKPKVVVLGSGPIRIGQGIEFDYTCVHACQALRSSGFETVMVNCNPETVSTDFDTSDRLYFEPLTVEDVLEVLEREKPLGVLVQLGGQTPLKLAAAIEKAGFRILGTPVDSIDRAEDRARFSALLRELGLEQPESGTAASVAEGEELARRIGYPVMVRPSYVLGGRAMQIVHQEADLARYLESAAAVAPDHPVFIDRFLEDAIEVDVDVLGDRFGNTKVCGVLEHVEEAGVHSGDATCVLPPYSLAPETVRELERQAVLLARALQVVGLQNVQFAVQNGKVHVLEVNPRASRTVPFVAKATGVPIAKLAALCMLGEPLPETPLGTGASAAVGAAPLFSVKESVFPFARFPGQDAVLGPEMRSTGEVMAQSPCVASAFLKAQWASGLPLANPAGMEKPILLFDPQGSRPSGLVGRLTAMGRRVRILEEREGLDELRSRRASLLLLPQKPGHDSVHSIALRKMAVERGVPVFTTLRAVELLVEGMERLEKGALPVAALQERKMGR
jgi:carbamoyl-phosphate synthase large subunit